MLWSPNYTEYIHYRYFFIQLFDFNAHNFKEVAWEYRFVFDCLFNFVCVFLSHFFGEHAITWHKNWNFLGCSFRGFALSILNCLGYFDFFFVFEPFPTYRHFLMPMQQTTFENIVTNEKLLLLSQYFQLNLIIKTLIYWEFSRFSQRFSKSSAADLL